MTASGQPRDVSWLADDNNFSFSVAGGGDLDGDGCADLALLFRRERVIELRSGADLELPLRVDLRELRRARLPATQNAKPTNNATWK